MSDDSFDRLKATKRNDVCPCGSGKKYKKCHLAEDQAAQNAADAKAEAARAAAAAAAEAEAEAENDAEAEEGLKNKSAKTSAKGAGPRDKQRGVSRAQSKSAKPTNLPRRKAI